MSWPAFAPSAPCISARPLRSAGVLPLDFPTPCSPVRLPPIVECFIPFTTLVKDPLPPRFDLQDHPSTNTFFAFRCSASTLPASSILFAPLLCPGVADLDSISSVITVAVSSYRGVTFRCFSLLADSSTKPRFLDRRSAQSKLRPDHQRPALDVCTVPATVLKFRGPSTLRAVA